MIMNHNNNLAADLHLRKQERQISLSTLTVIQSPEH